MNFLGVFFLSRIKELIAPLWLSWCPFFTGRPRRPSSTLASFQTLPTWEDAPCIIDKECLGKHPEWVSAVRQLQCGTPSASQAQSWRGTSRGTNTSSYFVCRQAAPDEFCVLGHRWPTPLMSRPREPRYPWQPLSHTSRDRPPLSSSVIMTIYRSRPLVPDVFVLHSGCDEAETSHITCM